jgi:hypothetical protein
MRVIIVCTLAVNFLLAGYAISGPGNGVETLLGYVFFAAQAEAKNIFFDSTEGRLDVLQEGRLAIQLANGYFAIQLVLEPVELVGGVFDEDLLTCGTTG